MKSLKYSIHQSLWGIFVASGCVFIALAALATYLRNGEQTFFRSYAPIAVALAISCLFAAFLVFRLRRDQKRVEEAFRKEAKEINEEIQIGEVEVLNVNTREIIEIDEPQNGNPTFCYRIGESSCVVLRYALDNESCNSTPNTGLEIIRLPKSKRILSVRQFGDTVRPQAQLEASLDTHAYQDGEVFECDWNQLLSGKTKI